MHILNTPRFLVFYLIIIIIIIAIEVVFNRPVAVWLTFLLLLLFNIRMRVIFKIDFQKWSFIFTNTEDLWFMEELIQSLVGICRLSSFM
jgi:hypothetical protein